MSEINFDDYAEKYNDILSNQLDFFDKDNNYFAEYKILALKKLLKSTPKTMLDFGCGIGRSTFFLQRYFPCTKIFGCDLSEKSLIKARESVPTATFINLNSILQSAITFDVIFIACVFHHIAPSQRLLTIKSILKMCSHNARIIVFEHNPYNPMTRYLVRQCPFDRDAILLAPRELKKLFKEAGIKNIQHHYTLFFPNKLRWLRFLEHHLRFFPMGGQYIISGQS